MTLFIIAPVEGFTGSVAGVAFDRGVGKCAPGNRSALAYFRRHGYAHVVEGDNGKPLVFGALPPWAARMIAEADAELPDVTVTVDGGEPLPVTVERTAPARNASNLAWIDYAIACGADPDEAAATSRADLIATYSPQED